MEDCGCKNRGVINVFGRTICRCHCAIRHRASTRTGDSNDLCAGPFRRIRPCGNCTTGRLAGHLHCVDYDRLRDRYRDCWWVREDACLSCKRREACRLARLHPYAERRRSARGEDGARLGEGRLNTPCEDSEGVGTPGLEVEFVIHAAVKVGRNGGVAAAVGICLESVVAENF